jgi:pyridoxine kinase
MMSLVLSITSDVTYGHVGLGAIRPVLFALGFECLALKTVTLAHHPGHGPPVGRRVPVDEMAVLAGGLEQLGLFPHIRAVLTGYFTDAAQVDLAAKIIMRLRAANPSVQVWCDPVMGDFPGGLYVPQPVADAISSELVPIADVVLPNAFEAEYLSGQKITDPASALQAAEKIKCGEVIITSVPDGPGNLGALWCHGLHADWASSMRRLRLLGGTGDCFAALALALRLRGLPQDQVLGHCVASLAALLDHPHDQGLPVELPLVTARHLLQPGAVPPARVERRRRGT